MYIKLTFIPSQKFTYTNKRFISTFPKGEKCTLKLSAMEVIELLAKERPDLIYFKAEEIHPPTRLSEAAESFNDQDWSNHPDFNGEEL